MRKDAGVDGDAQRLGQLAWMLFLKIYSDLELETELLELLLDDELDQGSPNLLSSNNIANACAPTTNIGDDLLVMLLSPS